MLKLRLLTGPRAGRQMRVSDTKPVSCGRRVGRLRLHDSRVSKHHAEIYYANGTWILRDLGSANGTFVNRRRVEGLVELEGGDLMQMGRVLIKIMRADGIAMDPEPGMAGAPSTSGSEGLEPSFDFNEASSGEASGISSSVFGEDDDDDLDLDALFADGTGDGDDQDADDSALSGLGLDAATSESNKLSSPDQDDASDDSALDDSAIADALAQSDPSDDLGDDSLGDMMSLDDSETSKGDQTPVDSQEKTAHDIPKDRDTSKGYVGTASGHDSDGTASADDDKEANDSTGDLISLEDEPDHRTPAKPKAGTTIIAAIDEDEDEDEDKPEIVGLHLNQQPPLKPSRHDELDQPQDAQGQDAALDSGEFDLDTQTGDDADDSVAAMFGDFNSPPKSDTSLEDLDSDDEEIDGGLGVDEAEATQATGAVDEPAATDETDQEADLAAGFADAAEFDSIFEADDSADGFDFSASQEPVELLDDATGVAEPGASIEPEAPAADDEVEQPDPAGAETPSEPEPPFRGPMPAFDIDAAFDALSEGLDDSLQLPAIGADLDADDLPKPRESSASASPDADPLAGSQLDVGFIKEALARLENGQTPNADPAGETPNNGNGPSATTPPPGLNPTSINPPSEPNAGHKRGGKRKGWFFTLVLLIGVLGGGGWLVYSGYIEVSIAGRPDDALATPNQPTPPLPGENEGSVTTQFPPGPATGGTPTNPQSTGLNTGQNNDPNAPDPFGEGPGVIGRDALAGITIDASHGSTPLPPQSDTPTQTGSTGTGGWPDFPTTGGQTNNNPLTDITPPIAGDPTVQPTPDTEPISPVPAEDARIVFLIDASGSLIDTLPQMLLWMRQAAQTVRPDEQFTVIFFKSGQAIEAEPGGLFSPSRERLMALEEDWLNPQSVQVLPTGRSDPTVAIQRAMTYEPTDLYILSDDAFAHASGDTTHQQAIDLVANAIGDAQVRVYGVQFFYRDELSVLQALSNRYGGEFEFVKEEVVTDANPVDLLQELGGE